MSWDKFYEKISDEDAERLAMLLSRAEIKDEGYQSGSSLSIWSVGQLSERDGDLLSKYMFSIRDQ